MSRNTHLKGNTLAFPRAGVSIDSAKQSMAYIRDVVDISGSIYNMVSTLALPGGQYNTFVEQAVMARTVAGLWHTSIMPELAAIAKEFSVCTPIFLDTMSEVLQIARKGAGPLSQTEVNGIQSVCSRFLWHVRDLIKLWYGFAKQTDSKFIGTLPGWGHQLDNFDEILQYQLRVIWRRNPERMDALMRFSEWCKGITNGILADVQAYYGGQGAVTDHSQIGILFDDFYGLKPVVCVMPPKQRSMASSALKQRLLAYNTQIQSYWSGQSMRADMGPTAAATLLASAYNVMQSTHVTKNLITFIAIWSTFGSLLESAVKAFQRNIHETSREYVVLDMSNARDYWAELTRYTGSFPQPPTPAKIVRLAEFM